MSFAPLSTEPTGPSAGSFESLDGAERAVAHLADEGIGEDEVAIVPRELRVRPIRPFRSLFRIGVPTGVLTGALLGGVAGATVWGTGTVPWWAIGLWVIRGVVIGLVAALLVALVGARRATGGDGGEDPHLEAGHFDVTAASQPGRARHLLARWWDPAARRYVQGPPPGTASG
jgi:hypothetical protein